MLNWPTTSSDLCMFVCVFFHWVTLNSGHNGHHSKILFCQKRNERYQVRYGCHMTVCVHWTLKCRNVNQREKTFAFTSLCVGFSIVYKSACSSFVYCMKKLKSFQWKYSVLQDNSKSNTPTRVGLHFFLSLKNCWATFWKVQKLQKPWKQIQHWIFVQFDYTPRTVPTNLHSISCFAGFLNANFQPRFKIYVF